MSTTLQLDTFGAWNVSIMSLSFIRLKSADKYIFTKTFLVFLFMYRVSKSKVSKVSLQYYLFENLMEHAYAYIV